MKKKISLEHVVREMPGRGNVHSGKCLIGDMSSRGSVLRGIVRSGNCPFREMSIREVSVGEVSVGELSSRGNVRIPKQIEQSVRTSSVTFSVKTILITFTD